MIIQMKKIKCRHLLYISIKIFVLSPKSLDLQSSLQWYSWGYSFNQPSGNFQIGVGSSFLFLLNRRSRMELSQKLKFDEVDEKNS